MPSPWPFTSSWSHPALLEYLKYDYLYSMTWNKSCTIWRRCSKSCQVVSEWSPPFSVPVWQKVSLDETYWWHLPTSGRWYIVQFCDYQIVKTEKFMEILQLEKWNFYFKNISVCFSQVSIKNRNVIVFWRATAKAFQHSKAQLKHLNVYSGWLTFFLLRPQMSTHTFIYLQASSHSRNILHQLFLRLAHIMNITHKPLLSVARRNLQKGKRAVVHENKHPLVLSAEFCSLDQCNIGHGWLEVKQI